MPNAPLNVVPFALLLDGFEHAVERLAAGVRTGEPADAFRPLFEALNWAVALDERVKEHWAPKGEGEAQPRWNWRNEVPDGDLVVAVRFARNRVHHQWSDALRLSKGITFPATFPVVFFEWHWRAVEELPPGRPNADGEAAYQARLQGHEAEQTMRLLREVFAFLRRLLEPTTI